MRGEGLRETRPPLLHSPRGFRRGAPPPLRRSGGGGHIPVAAITSDHKLGALKEQKYILLQFWRLKSNRGVGRSCPPRLWGSTPAAPSSWCPESWVCGCIAPANALSSRGLLPMCLLQGHRTLGRGPPVRRDLVLTNHSCKDPTSESGPILRCWVDKNLGRHCLPQVSVLWPPRLCGAHDACHMWDTPCGSARLSVGLACSQQTQLPASLDLG